MKTEAGTQSSEISRALESWYARAGGAEMLVAIGEELQPILDLAFGYHVLQYGPMARHRLIAGSPINHHLIGSDSAVGEPTLLCHGDELPLESDSVDMLVAFHALEFSAHPHACLREMQRVLRPRGHLVIIGFNPRSLAGLVRAARQRRPDSLWARHRPVSAHRLTDWLHLVNCELETIRHLHHLPLLGRGRLRGGIETVDRWALRQGLPGGSVYLAHALKQVPGARRPRPVRLAADSRLAGLAVAGRPTAAPRQPRTGRPDDLAA